MARPTRERRPSTSAGDDKPAAKGGAKRSEPASGGPPPLTLGLLHKLKILALANVVPLFLAAWLGWAWYQGTITFDIERLGSRGAVALVLLVACCAALAVSSWFIMPLARWLRDYPAWHYHHRSSSLWLVPTATGYLIWLVTWLAMGVCAIICVALMITGAWLLAEQLGWVGNAGAIVEGTERV